MLCRGINLLCRGINLLCSSVSSVKCMILCRLGSGELVDGHLFFKYRTSSGRFNRQYVARAGRFFIVPLFYLLHHFRYRLYFQIDILPPHQTDYLGIYHPMNEVSKAYAKRIENLLNVQLPLKFEKAAAHVCSGWLADDFGTHRAAKKNK